MSGKLKMYVYIVIGLCVTVKAGAILELTEKQYKRRKSLVKRLKKDKMLFEVVIDLQFKHGEEIKINQVMNKKQAGVLEEKTNVERKKETVVAVGNLKRFNKIQLMELVATKLKKFKILLEPEMTKAVMMETIEHEMKTPDPDPDPDPDPENEGSE